MDEESRTRIREERRTRLKELVQQEPLDQALHVSIVDLREHVTVIQVHIETIGLKFPETSEDIKPIVAYMASLSQSISELLSGTLMSRLEAEPEE